MPEPRFLKELEFFIANQDDLVAKHRGKVLAIQGEEVVGVYENNIEAYLAAKQSNQLGKIMIQACQPGPEAYTVTISSNFVCSW